ncbi:DUF2992 family protein [Actinomyces viscosus]|uniref:DUF2992 family protein n=1 Tax=Actinomyces viscosus TaxID=1656 RepID=UPI001E295616|nr:DUF2992 family protein [Actinomyces viscosus]
MRTRTRCGAQGCGGCDTLGGGALAPHPVARTARSGGSPDDAVGAELSDVELYDFLLNHGGDLIDRAAASAPVPASRSADFPTTARPLSPKRTARQAAKEAARARPSTGAQAALGAAREEISARVARNRSQRRRQESDEAWDRRRQRAQRRRSSR